ncbi:MAG: ethanolamine ammonia-lyase subunit EutC [Clostridia bacterium]
MNDQELERLVRRVMEELNAQPAPSLANGTAAATMIPAGELLPDIGAIDLRREYLVEHPHDGEAFLAMKLRTPARVGVGHAGARHRTETMLRFQADHAAAQDAVFSDVPEELLRALSLPAYQTTCQSRDEFLTRPDKGRVFAQETLQTIRQAVPEHTTVLLYMADGLSSSAVCANAADILPVICEGLRGYGISCNDPFFVKYGRVGTMDALGDVIAADVVCLLVGERPGLVTADSMSAYIAYRPRSGMQESRRTVLANIHAGGTPCVEAGAHIVDLIRLILEKKISGIELSI